MQGGIHHDRLGLSPDEDAECERLAKEIAHHGQTPTLIQPLLTW